MKSPLRNLREKLSISQRELATVSGASQGHVSEAERGMAELGPQLEKFLTELGEDALAVIAQHHAYMESESRHLRAAIQHRQSRP